MKAKSYIIWVLASVLMMVSCSDDFRVVGDTEGEIHAGDEVVFTTNVPKPVATTRALNTELLKGYQTISNLYELKVTMLKGDRQEVGRGTYKPVTKFAFVNDEDDIPANYDSDGTLEAVSNGLTWQTSTQKYAFEAVAGSDNVTSDQSTKANWLLQDRLHGYAFSPYEPEDGTPADLIGEPNYHTSKEWYQLNKAWHDAEGLMPAEDQKASDVYRKIPLFLQHERAWITVILKAGKGVKREAVAALYNEKDKTYNPNVDAIVYSYPAGGGDPLAVDKTLRGMAKVHYDEDVNGGASDDSLTMKFDAIVEPHNYLENPKDDKIAAINLSNMHFSFYASNDERFSSAEPEKVAAMQNAYNLTAGKHLTIEATLSTDRIVFITAWIEDWTEVVTSTICDDYGQNGDPTVIKSRAELLAFLNDPELNRAGNVAIISATELDLDKKVTPGATKDDPSIIEDDPWTNYNDGTSGKSLTLNATLNLAGATLRSSGRLVETISSTGNLIQGTIVMNNTTGLPSAIAKTNQGTIDHITLMGNQDATVTRAGFVETNHGYILNCSSSIPVRAGNESSETYIGGIAAKSIAPDQSTSPTIDNCTMYGAVKGGTNVKGGGIVGLGEGRLTNNTFDYGITLSQSPEYFKNIIHTKDVSGDLNTLTVAGNSWPTKALNTDAGDNASSVKYDNVLDSQAELELLITPTYNVIDKKYRIANDFTVLSDTWNHGQATEDITTQGVDCGGNLYCELDGNGKIITLDGTAKVQIPTAYDAQGKGTAFQEYETTHMLFSNITGYVHDLTIEVNKPLIATLVTNNEGKYNSTEAIAALAYAVRQPERIGTDPLGSYGVIRNVNVKIAEDAYVQGATAAGLVCWAYHDGVVENCNVIGPVLSWTPNNHGEVTTDAKRYVGGVVACAARATITNCTYSANGKTTLDIATYSGKMQTYYGGILGGTAVKGNYAEGSGDREEPKVSLVDCASWYQKDFGTTDAGVEERNHHGAILGYSYYTDINNIIGTIPEGDGACQGNWWQADMDGVALKGLLNGYTVETTIGKRNAVMPTQVTF